METNAIEVRGLRFHRGDFVLDDINFSLPTGHIAGFVGPNGAGKTTTIKAIAGLITPEAGSVRLFDTAMPQDADTRQRIGVVLDQATVAPEWRIGRIARRLSRLYRSWDHEAFAELTDRFELSTHSRAGELSRGQCVKLSLALALAHNPDLLILDEPSIGLDPVSRSVLGDVLRSFVVDSSHSVLFSTHITSDLESLADFLYVIDRGSIAYAGQLDELIECYAVVRGFGRPPTESLASILGYRQEPGRWDGLIESSNSSRFGSDVVLDVPTIDEVIVYLSRRPTPQKAHA